MTTPRTPGRPDEAIVPGSQAGFAVVEAKFRQAAAARADAVLESPHVFAGHGARIRLLGRRLAESVTPPFAHLVAQDGESIAARLAIDLWDEEECGITSPVPASDAEEAQGWHVGGGTFTLSADRRFAGFRFRRSVVCLDRKAQHLVGSLAGADALTLYERGKPLQVPLTMWYGDRGIQLVHAGLVARAGQGVLLPGRERAGKSTSALACLAAGFEYLGDDYVGLEARDEGTFVGHSVFASTWLEPAQLARFPRLAPHGIEGRYPDERKRLVLLPPLFPRQLVRRAVIRALALPRIVDATTTSFRPASKGEALLEIVPSSLFQQLLRPGAPGFRRLGELVERIPTYWLELGRDLERIPFAVDALLAEAMPR